MIVRCPQCQYANNTEVEAAKPRIVCARCATVISVEFLSNYNLSSVTEADSDRKDTYEKLNMQTPETSPLDLDTLLETPQPLPVVSPVIVTPLAATPVEAENRWDSDEILDIPRAAQSAQATAEVNAEAPLVVEELLSPTPTVVEATVLPTATEMSAEMPLHSLPTDDRQPFPPVESSIYDVQGSGAYVEAEHVSSQPVADQETTRSAAAGAGQSAVFGQDSYNFRANTFVVATPDKGNRTRLIRILLSVGLLCAVLAVGWWALSGLVKDWMGLRKSEVVENVPTANPPAGANPNKVGGGPTTVPSLGQKVGTVGSPAPNAAASASAVASASVVANAKASPSVAAKTSPSVAAPTPAPVQKQAPAPPQTGSAGHAVGSNEGSLTVQFASYKSAGEAQSTAARLKAAGVDARVVKADVPGKGTWYRVQGGRFTNESEAGKFGAEARAKGAARDFVITGYQAQ